MFGKRLIRFDNVYAVFTSCLRNDLKQLVSMYAYLLKIGVSINTLYFLPYKRVYVYVSHFIFGRNNV